jgi:hypothetical protein
LRAIVSAIGARKTALAANANAIDRGQPPPHGGYEIAELRTKIADAVRAARNAGLNVDDIVERIG